MACDRALESPRKIIFRSYLCPRPGYKFDIDQSKKTGRASVLLHQILGWEAGVWINEKARHRVISRVRDYYELWFFLNLLEEIFDHKETIPERYYRVPASQYEYLAFCHDVIHDKVVNKLHHCLTYGRSHVVGYVYSLV